VNGTLVLDDVEVDGRPARAVLVEHGLVRAVGERGRFGAGSPAPGGGEGPRSAAPVVDGRGGALLPGLHDHHVHLFASAMRAGSVWCGAPAVDGPAALLDRLRDAAATGSRAERGGWIRAVGWDDTVSGWPDRAALDAAVPDRPLRVQHRSGDLWVLNTRALDLAALDRTAPPSGAEPWPPGVETDLDGRPTGRVWGLDGWLRGRIGAVHPSLAAFSRSLAAAGVTGVTDAGAHNTAVDLAAMAAARASGELLQPVTAMTAAPEPLGGGEPARSRVAGAPPVGTGPSAVGVTPGPVKLVIAERSLPSPAELSARMEAAHRDGRAVAVHAASRVAVALALAALAAAGTAPGDRLEHAAVVDPGAMEEIARLGLTVVTQPHFVRENGDRYLATVERGELPWLYRGRGFLDAGVPLAAGSDAPVGGHDPWAVMAAAVERRTASGEVIGAGEELSPEQALALFTGPPDRPGGAPRRIAPGEPADLCLLDRPWAEARDDLAAVVVTVTVVGGRTVFGDAPPRAGA